MATAADLINYQDWHEVEACYYRTSPYNYAVINDFLAPEACSMIRSALINHKGWSFMNVTGSQRVLFIRNSGLPLIHEIASAVTGQLSGILAGLSLVEYSAFMNKENEGLNIHADNGMVTLNIYLTPDEYNLDSQSGGMLLYDVKRSESQALHEFNSEPWCSEYFARQTRGESVRIPYGFNRAILFDARTLHAAERMCFAGGNAGSYRLNLALRFDEPKRFQERSDYYISAASKL